MNSLSILSKTNERHNVKRWAKLALCTTHAIDQRVSSLVSLPSIIIQQSIFLHCSLPLFDWQSKHRYERIRRTPNIITLISIYAWQPFLTPEISRINKTRRKWKKKSMKMDEIRFIYNYSVSCDTNWLINYKYDEWINELSVSLVYFSACGCKLIFFAKWNWVYSK